MTPLEAQDLTVQASHALAVAGHQDMIWGHVAVRDPDGRGIWIKAPGWGLEEIDSTLLQLVSFEAEVLSGTGTPHKECHIHLAVLRARPDLVCSVHTHARNAVAFAALDVPLLALSHEGALFGGADVPRFRETGALISTPELGEKLAATLGDAPAALMPKHGLVAAGRSVAAAVMHAVLLERACRTQLTAQPAGQIRMHSDPAEARAKQAECWPESQIEAGWRYLLRRARSTSTPRSCCIRLPGASASGPRKRGSSMRTVKEVLQVICTDHPDRIVERDEDQLLCPPHPHRFPVKLWRDHEPLTVVHFPQEYTAQPFAPPRGIFENLQVRVEWQTMDNRQPFYHRNCDVDEISYQIAGDRTLMTELGVIEHRPGEFSRIPRGVAHDNFGRQESHLLFYTPAPAAEEHSPVRLSEPAFPAFPGWEPGALNEAVTQCLGTPGHDITVFPIDERKLLEHTYAVSDRLQVLCGADDGVSWLYRSSCFRMAVVRSAATDGRTYRRTLDADEIQYQISGRRTLVSQRGVIELGPGDFIRIPLGIAHTSISEHHSEHIALYADRELPQIAPTSRTAEPYTPGLMADLRKEPQS